MFRRFQIAFVLALITIGSAAVSAQELAVELNPAQTRVDFTLGDVLHTVHGDFQLKSGFLRLDEQNGAASGQLTVDATSGESGSKGRDRKMHQQVLESARFPDIIFQPQRVVGHVATSGDSQLQIDGLMIMHGQTHEIVATGPVHINGNEVSADLHFVVPYPQWGMKNPSTLFLRVSNDVEITVHAVGRLTATTTARTSAPPR
ncbi:MAG: YceI family protein [Terriglobales bacterium]